MDIGFCVLVEGTRLLRLMEVRDSWPSWPRPLRLLETYFDWVVFAGGRAVS